MLLSESMLGPTLSAPRGTLAGTKVPFSDDVDDARPGSVSSRHGMNRARTASFSPPFPPGPSGRQAGRGVGRPRQPSGRVLPVQVAAAALDVDKLIEGVQLLDGMGVVDHSAGR